MDDIQKNIEEYNPNKKREILVVFEDMIADILINIKVNQIVTELLARGKNVDIILFYQTICSKKY